MLPKPRSNTNGTTGSGCEGCPFAGDMQGFTPDTIRPGASVVLWAQGPGESEERGQRYLGKDSTGQEQWEAHPPAPLIGKTGRLMETTFLPLAGLNREDVSLSNSIRCRWNHQNTLPPLTQKVIQAAIKHCTLAHWTPPENNPLYVAMGEYATYTLTGLLHGFNGWRGYLLPKRHPWELPKPMTGVWTPGPQEPKVFVTYHLAYLFRDGGAELPAKRDWNKIPQILSGRWPEPYPGHSTEPPDLWPTYAAFDTEFDFSRVSSRASGSYQLPEPRLIRYSLATRDRKIWVVESERAGKISVAPGSTVIMHNAPADIPHLKGLLDYTSVIIEDSMMAHAVLWTGKVETDEQKGRTGGAMSHTLNFLGSMYSRFNRWKHLAHIAPKTYAGGDALGTMDVWETGLHGGLKGELERDPQSKWVYENLQKPLVPIILRMRQRGIAVDQEAAKRALLDIVRQQRTFAMQAQAYAGWELNLRSPSHVAFWLYMVEKLKVRRKFGAR